MATELSRPEPDPPASNERPPPWVRALGIAVPVAALGILVALKPEIVRGTFSSAESALRVAAVIAVWVLFSRLARRVVPNAVVRSAVVAVPAVLLLWLNVAPYFKDDVKVADSFPESFATREGTTASPSPEPMAPAGTGVTALSPVPSPPVQLSTGRFRGLDGHRGSGEASVFRQPDGSHIVAFRNLSVSSVPDPVLYLVPGTDQERVDGATRLGRFDATRDRYEIPGGVDLEGPMTVLIWCQRFAVPVAGSTQSPV